MLHYSLFIHEMGSWFSLSLGGEVHVRPSLPFRNALFDLRGMPLESPSCNERKVRRIRVRPDKTGMRFSLAYFSIILALRWQLYIYPLPFFAEAGGQVRYSVPRAEATGLPSS